MPENSSTHAHSKNPSDAVTHYRTCPLCEATCGLAIDVVGDEVTRVRGDQDDPFSQGFICPKGSQVGSLHHDPDRLRTPLVRKNGELVEATWDEAFFACSSHLPRRGSERNTAKRVRVKQLSTW